AGGGRRAHPAAARARGAREALAQPRLRLLGDAAVDRPAEARRARRGRAHRAEGARRVKRHGVRGLCLLVLPVLVGCAVLERARSSWWELERGPSGPAPDPATTPEAVVQVYAARAGTWPGPNSNTFTAWVGRRVPELRLRLPPTAIGKDYLPGGALAGTTPSGTGVQLSLYGLGGVAVGWDEGIELNFLTLNFGVDLTRPALKLPVLGRLGAS